MENKDAPSEESRDQFVVLVSNRDLLCQRAGLEYPYWRYFEYDKPISKSAHGYLKGRGLVPKRDQADVFASEEEAIQRVGKTRYKDWAIHIDLLPTSKQSTRENKCCDQ